MPISECRCCGGMYHWIWEEAFDKFGFGDGDAQIETEQVKIALVEAGYTVETITWGVHNTIINSIQKEGIELMPAAESKAVVGYDNPREYLPKKIIKMLDGRFPDAAQEV